MLVGLLENTTWSITGDDSGIVADIDFADFENLSGAANNEDTFFF